MRTSPCFRRLIGKTVCPSPIGEGMESVPFLVDVQMEFQKTILLEESLSLSPLGDREAYPSRASGRRKRGLLSRPR